jgi:hypothetical protein
VRLGPLRRPPEAARHHTGDLMTRSEARKFPAYMRRNAARFDGWLDGSLRKEALLPAPLRVAGLSGLRATKSPRSLPVPLLGFEPAAPAARRRPRSTEERRAALPCVSSLAAWLGVLDARILRPGAASLVAPWRAGGSRKPPGHEDIADRHEKPRPSRRQHQARDDDDCTKIVLGDCWRLRRVERRGDCYKSQCWPRRSFWPRTLIQVSTTPGASHARLRLQT